MPKPSHLPWFLQRLEPPWPQARRVGEAGSGHIGPNWILPELFVDLARILSLFAGSLYHLKTPIGGPANAC